MLALVQRVTRASVTIDGAVVAEIGRGMVVLLGVSKRDEPSAAEYLAHRTANLRIFNDAEGVPNINVKDAAGSVLVVSQFTLCADTRKGHRPSYVDAAAPEIAAPLYERYVAQLRMLLGVDTVRTGVFRADMSVEIVNDGPFTIILDTATRQ